MLEPRRGTGRMKQCSDDLLEAAPARVQCRHRRQEGNNENEADAFHQGAQEDENRSDHGLSASEIGKVPQERQAGSPQTRVVFSHQTNLAISVKSAAIG